MYVYQIIKIFQLIFFSSCMKYECDKKVEIVVTPPTKSSLTEYFYAGCVLLVDVKLLLYYAVTDSYLSQKCIKMYGNTETICIFFI